MAFEMSPVGPNEFLGSRAGPSRGGWDGRRGELAFSATSHVFLEWIGITVLWRTAIIEAGS
jgi:hypothetical protein